MSESLSVSDKHTRNVAIQQTRRVAAACLVVRRSLIKLFEADRKGRLARRPLLLGLALLFPLLSLFSMTVGPMDIGVSDVVAIILSKIGVATSGSFTLAQEIVVWDIRLTRILLAALVGAGLAMAGAAMQGVFRNPLADPGIIGVSGGGAIGAIAMIVVGGHLFATGGSTIFALFAVPVAAMLGAVCMTILIYRLSIRNGRVDVVSMLLVGIAINALGGAFTGLMTFIADDEQLRTMTFWGLGSVGRANWSLLLPALIFILPPLFLLPRFARALNALLLGDEDATHLGIDIKKVKRRIIFLAASLVGATVALCGAIGFIALVAPHIIRTAIGPDHRYLMAGSALLGGLLLLSADMVSRTVVAPAELPIGILTALLGAPVFLFLLMKQRSC